MNTDSRLNRLIELFRGNTPAVGCFAFNTCAAAACAIADSALDFVIVDLEHRPYDLAKLELYLLAMTDKRRILQKQNLQPDVIPLVRLPSNGCERVQYMVKQVLDLGIFGIVAPRVSSGNEASAIVSAMRFAHAPGSPDFEPQGQRGVGYPWAARYWGLPGSEYAAKADLWPLDSSGELLLWCMIETLEGVENSHEIISTPGVGGILIGPSDLSFSVEGFKGGLKSEAYIQKILAECKESGLACGIVTTPADLAERLDQGFNFLAVGTDTGLTTSVETSLGIYRQYIAGKC